MKLLDFFKKREKIKRLEKTGSVANKISTEVSEEKGGTEVKKNLGQSKFASAILLKPRITEKSSLLGESGVYVFRILNGVSKPEVKKAVEELYQVKVEKINMASMPSRIRRLGRKIGRRPGYKKASVRLAKGQKIEFS